MKTFQNVYILIQKLKCKVQIKIVIYSLKINQNIVMKNAITDKM